jgi:hypothetical protein
VKERRKKSNAKTRKIIFVSKAIADMVLKRKVEESDRD